MCCEMEQGTCSMLTMASSVCLKDFSRGTGRTKMVLVLKSRPEVTKMRPRKKTGDDSRQEKEITCLRIWVCGISEPLELEVNAQAWRGYGTCASCHDVI